MIKNNFKEGRANGSPLFIGKEVFIMKTLNFKKTIALVLCMIIVVTGTLHSAVQNVKAADCSGKYTAPEKQIKTTINGYTSSGTSSHFSITSMTTTAFKNAVGSIGVCNTIGKPSGGKSGGKVKAGVEIGQSVAKGTTTTTSYKKYVYVMYYALHKGYLTKYNTTFVKINRTLNYIRQGEYKHAQNGDYNRGLKKSDYDNLISTAKTYYNNQTGGPKDHFYCWKWTNSDPDKQNFLTCKQMPIEYNLSLTKSASTYDDILTNDYTCEGIEYDVYKNDKETRVGTLTCTETGTTNILTGLSAGTYYAKESKTNSCFILNEEWVGPVTLTQTNNSGAFEAEDEPNFIPFSLQKKLDVSGDTEKSLEGFQFTLTYLMSELEDDESSEEPEIEELSSDAEETSSDAGGEDEEDTGDYGEGDENTHIIFEGTTDDKGQIKGWRLVSPTNRAEKYSEIVFDKLPIGRYKLTENLETPQFEEDKCETVTTNPQTINLVPDNATADATFTWINKYPPKEPVLHTSARGGDTGTHITKARENTCICDTVSYENMEPGQNYTIVGRLMDKESNTEIRDKDGKIVTTEINITPKAASGSCEISFTNVDTSMLAGHSVVVFENVYKDGQHIASHEEINNLSQTVHIAKQQPPYHKIPNTGDTNILYLYVVLALAAIALTLTLYSLKSQNKTI